MSKLAFQAKLSPFEGSSQKDISLMNKEELILQNTAEFYRKKKKKNLKKKKK